MVEAIFESISLSTASNILWILFVALSWNIKNFWNMFSYVDYLVFYFDDAFCEINRFFEQFCRYWRVELRNVKVNEFIVVFFWKTHTFNHTQSFRHISHVNHTELSKYLWTLKGNGTGYHRKKSIKSYTSCDKCGTKGFDLCLTKELNWYQNVAIGASLFWTASKKIHLIWDGKLFFITIIFTQIMKTKKN